MYEPDQKIKDKILSLWDKNRGKSFVSFIRENPDVDEYLEKMVESDAWFRDKRRAFVCVANGIYEKKKCENCGKEINLIKACKGTRFCSHQCGAGSSNHHVSYNAEVIARMKQKREETNLKRYGTKYPMQSKQVKEKHKQTCLEKYGVENAIQSQEIQEKRKQICLKKYGVDNPFKTKEVREKQKKTCMDRYGVESTLSTDFVKEKAKKTLIKNYGVDNPFKSKEIREKSEHTCLKRYGVKNAAQSSDIKNKIKQNNFEKYGYEYVAQTEYVKSKRKETLKSHYGSESYFQSKAFFGKMYEKFKKWKDYVVPMFTADEYVGAREKEYLWKCVKCGNIFKQHIHSTSLVNKNDYIPRCLKCYPHSSITSNMEKEVLEFIKLIYNGKVVENDRSILKGREIDIYLPDAGLGIEFDGLFWHNDQSGKKEDYHLNKTAECEMAGVHLIHIFEDEWIGKQEIVKDRIKSYLKIYDRILYARKCELKEIDSKTSDDFLEANHLQGSEHSSIRYGLFYENELVSVMTFGKPRFNEKHDFEMIRYCSKIGIIVIGGASKLLACFEKKYPNKLLITYADRRYSTGNLYEILGFEKIQYSCPNYWWTKKQIKLSRYQCQKHRLHKILENDFNPDLSESENMILNGWNRIYDCGNIVYSKRTGD